jgi:hypothetical protein
LAPNSAAAGNPANPAAAGSLAASFLRHPGSPKGGLVGRRHTPLVGEAAAFHPMFAVPTAKLTAPAAALALASSATASSVGSTPLRKPAAGAIAFAEELARQELAKHEAAASASAEDGVVAVVDVDSGMKGARGEVGGG